MTIRKLYGIGVGPGNPELLTLKAYKVLKEVSMIVAPKSSKEKRSLALSIIENIIKEREKNPFIVEPLFPMTKKREKLNFYWEKAKEEVLEKAKGCETIAFITLGDPSFYSTFYKFLNLFKSFIDEVEVIPGVTSFSACSSLAMVPLAEDKEIVSIVPKVNDESEEVISKSDTVVFLKQKDTRRIKKLIGEGSAILGIKIGFEEEKLVMGNLKEVKFPGHYLSTFIVKKGEKRWE